MQFLCKWLAFNSNATSFYRGKGRERRNIKYNIRIQIKEKIKEKILEIDWKNKNLIKYGEIRKFMENATKNQKKVIILIEGNKDRIDYINRNIDKWMQKQARKLKRKEIMIINCYEVSEFNQSLQEILDNHDKILNTSGIHEIEEIYAGYIRKRA